MSNKTEQGQRRNGRLGTGHINPETGLELVCTVNQGSLLQLVGNTPEKIQHEHDVVNRHRHRQDQRPDGIHQVQVLYQQISRDQPAGKQHGEKENPGIKASQPQLRAFLGQRIGYQNGNQHGKRHADTYPFHRFQQRIPEIPLSDNIAVGIGIKLHRPEGNPSRRYRRCAGKGHGQYIQQRKQAQDGQQNQNRIIDNLKDNTSLCHFFHCDSLP